jgi:hypothetical protein
MVPGIVAGTVIFKDIELWSIRRRGKRGRGRG